MKAFMQIARPHEDILEGKVTMDVFAADLWQVVNGKSPVDYKDSDLFFKKTYVTKGLENILDIAKQRLEGRSGDAVIQLQTPFGGGKTHTLIALYHKAKEWNAKVVVFDGTAFNPVETKPWQEIERQLTGKVEQTKGDVSPGKDKLINLISKNSPVLILMDEILEYVTKAAGIKIGESNLASQTLAFMQELTGAVSANQNALLVITLPSSVLERYDEHAEKLFQQLQKVTGRLEKIYTPVEEEEISHVIRKRLFQSIDENGAKKVIDNFIEYAKSENILSGDEAVRYRDRFLKSYPFKPDVIDILYKRWGSFPTFQRTRGVLRLLSLVIQDVMDKKIPFIRIGDFNLKNNEIKRELIKHIGQEWDSIISNDITSDNSGAKRVDDIIGASYKPYKLGTAVSTTIFMMSFSGRGERGSSITEIKISVLFQDFSSNVIDTVLNKLKEHLFYLSDEDLYFTNQPNLNRILLNREESISQNLIIDEEKTLLKNHIKNRFKTFIYPDNSRDISDIKDLKLIILKEEEPRRDFIEKCGEIPRIYRNTMLFLCTDESQRGSFYGFLKKILALKSVEKDQSLKLTEGQKKEIKNKIKLCEQKCYEELRKYYRKVFVPSKNNFKEIDLGVPTLGETLIDSEIYKRLRDEGEILEKISPVVIKDRYLSNNDYVPTKNLLSVFWQTPGEMRIASEDALRESIREGVEKGIFGLGYIENGISECKYFRESAVPEFPDNEIIIKSELCEKKAKEEKEPIYPPEVPLVYNSDSVKEVISEPKLQEYEKIHLKLNVPKGQMSPVTKIVSHLNSRFNDCEVKIEITAQDGKISISDYENIIDEIIKQANIKIEEEEFK